VEIRVRDTGRGMTRDEKRRAFLPGYTTKKFGWGLGLPLARRIVEHYHSGQLIIESSQPGKGTCFLIRMRTRGGKR
jgi:signal transduction histidine kinase